MKAKDNLTNKQRVFVEGVIKGKPGTIAALEAYDTTDYNTAAVIATENLNKPKIQDALEPFLKKHNLSIDRALKPISEALDAVEVKYDKEGNYVDTVVNHSVRLQASDRTLKLLGITQSDTNTVAIHLTDKSTTYNL